MPRYPFLATDNGKSIGFFRAVRAIARTGIDAHADGGPDRASRTGRRMFGRGTGLLADWWPSLGSRRPRTTGRMNVVLNGRREKGKGGGRRGWATSSRAWRGGRTVRRIRNEWRKAGCLHGLEDAQNVSPARHWGRVRFCVGQSRSNAGRLDGQIHLVARPAAHRIFR